MDAALVALGIVLAAIGLRDVFHVIIRPSGNGTLSGRIVHVAWRAARATRSERVRAVVGPVSLVLVLVCWTAIILFGFALVYWSQMPDAFQYGGSLRADANDRLVDALYFSLVTITTVGYGDIAATSVALRFAATTEAVIGFALLSASVSWVLSLHQSVLRQRSLARRMRLWLECDGPKLAAHDPAAVATVLRSLTDQLVTVLQDLRQVPMTYYFYAADPRESLPCSLRELSRVLDGLRGDRDAALANAAAELDRACTEYTQALRDEIPSVRRADGPGLEQAYAEHSVRA